MFSGISQSMVLSTGINLISEVVGVKGSGGAFVFGAYSFGDKFTCGIAIFFISLNTNFKNGNESFFKWITILVPLISCLFATLIVMGSKVQEYNEKDK